jgi:hypothetical protein
VTSRTRVAVWFLLACAPLATALPSAADERGLMLGRVSELKVSGRVVALDTGAPLSLAEVTVETERARERFVTDYDGRFSGVVNDEQGLGLVSVIFAHSDRRAKDLDTVSFELIPKTVDASSDGSHIRVKAKKVDLNLACDGHGSVASQGINVDVTAVCGDGLTGIEYAKGPNRFAILAPQPFALRVGNGRIEVRDLKSASVTLRADVALRTR